MEYAKVAATVFATATVPDGYFGDRTSCGLALVGNTVVEVFPFGYHRNGLQSVTDVREAKWMLINHPEWKQRYKNVKMKD